LPDKPNHQQLEKLSGTPGKVGMLEGTENMLAHCIARIMQFSSRDLPQRPSWLHLYTAPDRIRDNVQAIEDYLAEAETLICEVADSGAAHRGELCFESGQYCSVVKNG
jgi:hypothetical protein